MSIVQALIGAIASSSSGGGGPPPTPTYTFTPQTVSADEGSGFTFEIGGTNIVNGTYYWTIETSSGEFTTTSGSFTINNNYGVITVTPTADATTEVSAETFTVSIRSGSITGTVLATSSAITINDTSQSLVAPFSLDFPAGNPYLLVSNTQSDWNLGTTYTIEFWSKQTNASTNNIRTVMSQGPDNNRIDLGFMFGSTLFSNVQRSGILEPTPAVWSHVAYVADGGGNTKVYYNGVFTGEIVAPGALSDGSSDLNIGRRLGVNGQGYLGKLAMIRISTTAKYVANFNPTATYGAEADTKLFLGSDTPLVDSVGTHSITNNGAVVSTDFPTTYTITPASSTVDEGASLTFTVGGTKIVNGTYYWTATNSGDFGTASGSFSITSNTGSFSVTPSADVTTEGSETFTVALRSVSTSGTILSTSTAVTINDTSLAPVPPFSLQFVNSEADYLEVAQPSYTVLGSATNHAWSGTISSGKIFKGSYPEPQVGWTLIGQQSFQGSPAVYQVTIATVTDGGATWDLTWAPQVADNLYMDENYSLYDPAQAAFNLGSTWTIEFWLKANASSDTAPGGIWGLLNQVGWSMTNSVVVALSDNKLVFLSVAANANDDVRYVEPTPGQWTHVAITNDAGTQKVWYNGVEQTKVSGTFGTASYTNGIAPLRIGRLGPANGGTLNGKMAMVRISNTAKYAAAFVPVITYGVNADTRLFLSSDTPLVDSGMMFLTVTNTGVTQSTDFPTPSTYTITPDANNVDEGWPLGVVIGGTNIPNGTYYWTVTNGGDFGTASGEFNITDNVGVFEFTPTTDNTTEGAETFTISVRSVSTTGTILVTSDPITINDTSTTPAFSPDYTITVTNSGNSYRISGSDRTGGYTDATQPALVFNNGDKVRFNVNAGTASAHPFYIKTTQSSGTGNQVSAVSGQGTTTLEWTTSDTGVGSYGYQCSIHFGMWNTITIA